MSPQKTFIVLLFCLAAFHAGAMPGTQLLSICLPPKDTMIVRQQNTLTHSYELELYERSCSYYRVHQNDTSEISLLVLSYKSDSSFSIHVLHKKPVLFSDVWQHLQASLPYIKEDFGLNRIRYIYFKSPLYYPDLSKGLSAHYARLFGQKGISDDRLNQFLLSSELNTKLNHLLAPLQLQVKRYSIEKFMLTQKSAYIIELPDVDTTDYPPFSIHGMGISVRVAKSLG